VRRRAHSPRVVHRKTYSQRVRRYREVSDCCWLSTPESAVAARAACSSSAGNSGSPRERILLKAMGSLRAVDNSGARILPLAMCRSGADASCRCGRRVRFQRQRSPKFRPRPTTKGTAPALRISACVSLTANALRIHCCRTQEYKSVMFVTGAWRDLTDSARRS
jgi:hypothetical protein